MSSTDLGNPRAQVIRVYYEGGSKICQGMPVCYNYDTTDNWYGWSGSAESGTTAEGSHNEGKYFRVENPSISNLDWFAGVIAKASPNIGKTGPAIVDIYVPNGAVVPVKTVLTATDRGRTILAINSGTQTFGNPTSDIPSYGSTAGTIDARPVAVAEETISSAGLVLAKLCPDLFVHQGGQIGYEMQVAAGTVKVAVNRMNVQFANTSADQSLLHYRAKLNGAGGAATRGVYRFETFITAVPGGAIYGSDHTVNIDANVNQGTYINGLRVTMRSRVTDPNLSSDLVSCVDLQYIFTGAAGGALANPPAIGTLFYFNTDVAGSKPNYLWYCSDHRATNATVITPVASQVFGFDGDAAMIKIPIFSGGNTYYLIAGEAVGYTGD